MKKWIFFPVDPRVDDELSGLADNMRRLPAVYPGWEVVAVVSEAVEPGPRLTELAKMGGLGRAHKSSHPIQDPLLAAFVQAALTTPNHRFLVRSPYCRVCNREAAAVKQWEASNAQFHVIRDHVTAHNVPVVPNLWGSIQARVGQLPIKLAQWLDSFLRGTRSDFLSAESLAGAALAEVVWPQAKHWGCMRHDIVHRDFEVGEALPFPECESDDQPSCGLVYTTNEGGVNAPEERKESGDDLGEHIGTEAVGEATRSSDRDRDGQGREEKEKEVLTQTDYSV